MRWEAKKKIKELLPLKVPFHLNILSPQVTGTVLEELNPNEMGGKKENKRVASPESSLSP